jgi:hypothetical protein
VLQDSVTEDAVEASLRKGQRKEVGLEKRESRVSGCCLATRIDGSGRVDGPYLGTGVQQDLGEASGAAADLENTLSFQFGCSPTGAREEAVPTVAPPGSGVELNEPVASPLLTEACGVPNVIDEARDAVANREPHT